MAGTGCREEAMLYYLYMMSDGEVSYSEEKLFNEICRKLDLDEEEKRSVISRCRESVSDLTDAFNVVIREKLEEQVGQEWPGYQKDASSLARIIWNLVDLGYADTYYSENEKKIVRYLVGKWEIDPEVYQEMIDTADTMLALTKQKEWIISTIPKGSKRDRKEKKIDSEIDRMHADLRLTIDELTM